MMKNIARTQRTRERLAILCKDSGRSASRLAEPSKCDLQTMLAQAAKETEEDTRIDEFVRAVGALWKGKRH